MFQFPIATWTWPSFIPIIGGNEFRFFEPVFNIADSAVTIGILLFIYYNYYIDSKNTVI